MVPSDVKKHKIVIVDDDEDLLKIMTYGFQLEVFEVITFKDGKEALKILLDENYIKDVDLLILDRLMPDIDGIDILRELTKQHAKNVPLVLILSVFSTDKEVAKGLQLGAVDYISKPFKLNLLMDKAKSLISRYKK
jgi:two-component system alkaline phosphatase synthesis response regulator PhoP